MKITSRNVNGIRAVLRKGFAEWVQSDNSDIYCFQETKAFEHQLPQDLKQLFSEYDYCRHAGPARFASSPRSRSYLEIS